MDDKKTPPPILSARYCVVCDKRILHRLKKEKPLGGFLYEQLWICQECGFSELCFDTEPAKPLPIQYD